MFGDSAAIFSTFIVVFREALEAGLIIGIILTVLKRLKGERYFSHVMVSVMAAGALSLWAGSWIAGLTEGAQERTQEMIEGFISLVAAGVLTYMFFWMERQGRHLKTDLETKMEAALSAKDHAAMVSLPFFAVFREGAETVLFLKAVSIQNGGAVSWAGGLAGLGLAALLSAAIFIGGKKVPLKNLFRATGILILFMAAGLLAYGIHELEEAKLLNPIIYPVWNINFILNEKRGVGSFLKALFGYNGNPSLVEVTAYVVYLFTVIFAVTRQRKELKTKIKT